MLVINEGCEGKVETEGSNYRLSTLVVDNKRNLHLAAGSKDALF